MSNWTHIIASFTVETNCKDANIDRLAYNTISMEAPSISGSEGTANVFVSKPAGHNVHCSPDCQSCEYRNTYITDEESQTWSCLAPEDYQCPSGDYQTILVITIQGDLRDRYLDQTKGQLLAFEKYLKESCQFYIIQRTGMIHEDVSGDTWVMTPAHDPQYAQHNIIHESPVGYPLEFEPLTNQVSFDDIKTETEADD